VLRCRFEFLIFGVFAGMEPATSGQTVTRSDQLSYFYIVSHENIIVDSHSPCFPTQSQVSYHSASAGSSVPVLFLALTRPTRRLTYAQTKTLQTGMLRCWVEEGTLAP